MQRQKRFEADDLVDAQDPTRGSGELTDVGSDINESVDLHFQVRLYDRECFGRFKANRARWREAKLPSEAIESTLADIVAGTFVDRISNASTKVHARCRRLCRHVRQPQFQRASAQNTPSRGGGILPVE